MKDTGPGDREAAVGAPARIKKWLEAVRSFVLWLVAREELPVRPQVDARPLEKKPGLNSVAALLFRADKLPASPPDGDEAPPSRRLLQWLFEKEHLPERAEPARKTRSSSILAELLTQDRLPRVADATTPREKQAGLWSLFEWEAVPPSPSAARKAQTQSVAESPDRPDDHGAAVESRSPSSAEHKKRALKDKE